MIRFFRNSYMASRLVARCFLVALLSTACIRNGQGEVATEDSLVITSVATLDRDTPSVLVREVAALEEVLSCGNAEDARKHIDSVRAQLEQIEAALEEARLVGKPADSVSRKASLPVDAAIRMTPSPVDSSRNTLFPSDSVSRLPESSTDSLSRD